jgi:hypothetical protein
MNCTTNLFIQNPAYQALLFVLLTPIVILTTKPKTADRAWMLAIYLFAGFLALNTALLWWDDSPWHYLFYSLGFSVGYILFVAVMMPVLLKPLRLKSSQESAMAFLIVIYQPLALLLIMLAKWMIKD